MKEKNYYHNRGHEKGHHTVSHSGNPYEIDAIGWPPEYSGDSGDRRATGTCCLLPVSTGNTGKISGLCYIIEHASDIRLLSIPLFLQVKRYLSKND